MTIKNTKLNEMNDGDYVVKKTRRRRNPLESWCAPVGRVWKD
jgi:hypothetical protein